MSKSPAAADWREAKRRLARASIVEAAWDAVRDEGLAALSLRELATRAGIPRWLLAHPELGPDAVAGRQLVHGA